MISRFFHVTLDYLKWSLGAMVASALLFAFVSAEHSYPTVLGTSFVGALLWGAFSTWQWLTNDKEKASLSLPNLGLGVAYSDRVVGELRGSLYKEGLERLLLGSMEGIARPDVLARARHRFGPRPEIGFVLPDGSYIGIRPLKSEGKGTELSFVFRVHDKKGDASVTLTLTYEEFRKVLGMLAIIIEKSKVDG